MPLSEDLVLLEAFLSVVAAGEHELTPEGIAELRVMLARAAETAAEMEVEIDGLRAWRRPPVPSSDPGRADALAEGLRSGKVVRLAAVRLARSPELQQPGWLA